MHTNMKSEKINHKHTEFTSYSTQFTHILPIFVVVVIFSVLFGISLCRIFIRFVNITLWVCVSKLHWIVLQLCVWMFWYPSIHGNSENLNIEHGGIVTVIQPKSGRITSILCSAHTHKKEHYMFDFIRWK